MDGNWRQAASIHSTSFTYTPLIYSESLVMTVPILPLAIWGFKFMSAGTGEDIMCEEEERGKHLDPSANAIAISRCFIEASIYWTCLNKGSVMIISHVDVTRAKGKIREIRKGTLIFYFRYGRHR